MDLALLGTVRSSHGDHGVVVPVCVGIKNGAENAVYVRSHRSATHFHSYVTIYVVQANHKPRTNTGSPERDEVKCSDNPCKHGTCSDHSSSFICSCDPGYKGIDCDTRKTCSEGITCQNGGTCQDGPNGFQCHCSNKFSGEFCEKVIKCVDTPCVHGTCQDTSTGFNCNCDPKFSGFTCDTPIKCTSNPCIHGTCSDTPLGYNCHCEEKYTGTKCDSPCSSQPCLHGTCANTPSGFSCACDVKYTGAKCDQLVKCTSTPCIHGACSDTPSGFQCLCDIRYTGIKCDKSM
uniref:Neurogenic locus notch-like protein 1 n=1 Tax=Magallana gigas TaxID=29159 RepID=K1R4H3_MAGGI